MRDLLAVRTPENVVFEHELAGLTTRALAWAVDVAVMSALVGTATLVSSLFGLVLAGFAKAFYFVALFAIQWGYGVVLEWRWRGQTVGKRLLGLRVLGGNGLTISFRQAALRNLLRVADILPGGYLLGAACMLCDARVRRVGDIAADTVVVRARAAPRPTLRRAPELRYNSFAYDERLVEALESITPPERELMLSLAARRDVLPVVVRHELFAQLAQHLQERLGIARPEFLSEERFVVNLSALALRSPAKRRDFDRPTERA